MAFSLDKTFGIYPQALDVHERRAEIISNNLVNQDTPGFKAQDLDFRTALATYKTQMQDAKQMGMTSVNHQNNANDLALEYLKFRTSSQPSLDGNTVDGQIEKSEYAENSIRYITSLNILSSKIKGLMTAIKGSQ